MSIKDARIDKPMTNDQGVSDPVNVFTTNGMVLVAWWNSKDKYWHSLDGDTFGNVIWWSAISFPKGWEYDDSIYC